MQDGEALGRRASTTAAPGEVWETVGPLDGIQPGSLHTFKRRGHQLVVLCTTSGELHALDNRCPHEGYPLAQGELKDCTLTCNWHNWKFDVRDGRCLLGGENVRAYPVRVREGFLEVDLADPPPEALWPGLRTSLEKALFDADTDWAIRDGARLLRLGYDPWRLLADLARYDALHAEYGATHVLALAADCGRLLERYTGVNALYPIAPVIDLCAETNVRLPERPRTRVPPPGDSAPLARRAAAPGNAQLADSLGDALRDAVEAEDGTRAEAVLAGALDAGSPRLRIEAALGAVLADHFLDFGHPLIYFVKVGELLDRVDMSYARDIYLALLHNIVLATREDRLPYLRGYFRRMDGLEPELDRVQGAARSAAPCAAAPYRDAAPCRDAVLDGSVSESVEALLSTLRRGVPAAAVARALVAAAAHRLLRFDTRWEEDPDVAEGWLWATHRLTFASAVRNAVDRLSSPAAARLLLQAAAFVHSGRAMDAPPERRVNLEALEAQSREGLDEQRRGAPAASSPRRCLAAVREHRADEALLHARVALRDPAARSELQRGLEDLCIQDPLVRPIFVAHAIKTTFAAFEARAALAGCADQDVPVLAAVRFLASPVRERDVHASVRTALRWVVEGVGPRKLTQ